MATDYLEIVVRNVTWKGSDYVDTDEIDNCNTAVNDALDAIANLAFDGIETINIYNDETPSS